jgi:YVTN family beta-propeller protein
MKTVKIALLITLICSGNVFGQRYKLQNTIPIGGSGGWDYLMADSDGRRLYVSHGTEVVVLDLDSQKIVGRVSGLTRIHGIALDHDANKGFISDGGANQIVAFDLKTLAVEQRIQVGQNPDAILFDPASKKVMAFNGRSQDISVIDPSSGSVAATLKAGGKPEFAVSDGKGSVYFNIEDKNEIGHLDASSLTVKDHWSIAPCDSPSGLALDTNNGRLFAVCDGEQMVIVDTTSGKVVSTVPIGKGPDATGFDAAHKLAFSSNGQDGTLTIVKQSSADQYAVLQTVKTQPGARTMTVDQKTGKIFLPTASFGPTPAASATTPRPRPTILPDTFRLLVVAPE